MSGSTVTGHPDNDWRSAKEVLRLMSGLIDADEGRSYAERDGN